MKIVIAGSMQFAEKMIEAKSRLKDLGHEAYVSMETESLAGKTDEQKEEIKLSQKLDQNAIKEFWKLMENADALLVLNYDKKGIKNYVGGNSLMDMAIAYHKNQKIFLINPIPDIPFYKSELEAMKPVIVHDDWNLIK